MDETTMEAAHMRVLEMFAAVCGDPDNPRLAAEADEALWWLDEMLDGSSSPDQ